MQQRFPHLKREKVIDERVIEMSSESGGAPLPEPRWLGLWSIAVGTFRSAVNKEAGR